MKLLAGAPRVREADQKPESTSDDLVISVRACGVDAYDTETLRLHHDLDKEVPLGWEISGVVETVGVGAQDRFAVGDEVVAVLDPGTLFSGYAQHCRVPANAAVHKPAGISHEVAAASLKSGIAAFTALHYQAHITPGDTVLILNGCVRVRKSFV